MPRRHLPWTFVLAIAATPGLAQHPGNEGPTPLASPPRTELLIPGLKSLTITGEYRVRVEEVYNYDLDEKVSDDRDFVTQRFRLGFDAAVTDDLGAVVQFQDVRDWGEEAGTTEDSADGFDVHRAYLRWNNNVLGGDMKVGRQVLSFGDDRLVGNLEWLSQGRAFDGVRQTFRNKDGYSTDLFAMDVKERVPSAVYDDAFFGGIYSTIPLTNAVFDLYYLFLHDEETLAGGNEQRSTFGLRYVRTMGSVEFGTELATQFGDADGADIAAAYAAHVHGTYTMAGESAPFVRLEVNWATGDDPNTSENERFSNLFPTAHKHWGMMDLAQWENMLHGMVQVGYKPAERSKLAASWHYFQSEEETDRFVGPVGRPVPGGAAAGSSNTIGSEVDLFYNVQFETKPATSFLEVGYGIFFPGAAADMASGDDTAHFFYLMSGLKF